MELIEERDEGKEPVAIGIGGGHYAPRFTDLALKKKASFGHMIPNYQIDEIGEEMLEKVIGATPRISEVYFHGDKGYKFKEWFERKGLMMK
jgi:D-aminoacyl-tRNA deacylase